jgi:hypothetical protein
MDLTREDIVALLTELGDFMQSKGLQSRASFLVKIRTDELSSTRPAALLRCLPPNTSWP